LKTELISAREEVEMLKNSAQASIIKLKIVGEPS